MTSPVEYDPFSEQAMDDPYPLYRDLREHAPVYFMPRYNAWALARFDDIWNASTDARHYSVRQGNSPPQILTHTQPVTPMFGLDDPPRHTQIRSQIRSFFTPAAIAPLEELIRQTIRDAFDASAGHRIDIINDIGLAVSVRVALLLSGIPLEDADLMRSQTERFFARDPLTQSITDDGLAAVGEMQAYFEALVRERRKKGVRSKDVLDAMLHLEVEGRRLRDDEICANLQLLVHGGTETLPKVLANTLVRLAEEPDQRARVVADRELGTHAFREALRIDMPTQFLGRTVVEEVEIRGEKLQVGQTVIFLYASANRDPAEFDDPHRFDIDRRPARILSFGHGVHACLGRNVALLEGGVALDEILARAPEYELDLAAACRYRTEFVQGFQSLYLILPSN